MERYERREAAAAKSVAPAELHPTADGALKAMFTSRLWNACKSKHISSLQLPRASHSDY